MDTSYYVPISSAEILQKIEQGEPIDCKFRLIVGDLDLSQFNLPANQSASNSLASTVLLSGVFNINDDDKFIKPPITIRYCKIEGNTNFANVIFQGSIDFDDTIFNGAVDFSNARFVGTATFNNSCFHDDVEFYRSIFNGPSSFRGAKFKKKSSFLEAKFNKEAWFGRDDLYSAAEFEGSADFSLAKFEGYTYFDGVTFLNTSNFMGSVFKDDVALFEKASFHNFANFSGVRFSQFANFRSAKFFDDADFRYVNFGEAIFESVRFDGMLFLDKSMINIMDFSNTYFHEKSKVSFKDFSFWRLFVRWNDFKDHLSDSNDDSAYLSLIQNFKNIGFFGDADDCLYWYGNWRRKNQAQHNSCFKWIDRLRFSLIYKFEAFSKMIYSVEKKLKVSWPCSINGDDLAWMSCGYGVRPCHTLFLSVLIILMFGLIYHFFADQGITKFDFVSGAVNIGLSNGSMQFARKSSVDSFYFSTMIFISQVPSNYYVDEFWKFIVMVERLFGWILMAVFIVVLSKKWIR